jgi:putative flavoprotein involved in K+ transport
VAGALGLPAALHAGALRQPARQGVSGDPDHYPTRDEVVAYLSAYARDLPVELGSRVCRLRSDGAGFRVELDGRSVEADQVVVATGPFQTPRTPALATRLSPGVTQLHSAAYRHPAQLPAGPVLVVGGGNTGYQIAEELSSTHEVHLAVGSRQKPIPQRVLGRDIFRYLDAVGALTAPADTRLGRRMKAGDTLVGSSPRRARRQGIRLRPRATGAGGSSVTFADGTAVAVATVIWPPASPSTTPGSTPPSSAPTVACSSSAASPPPPACTSSACPGCTPAAPRCWAG